MSARAVRRARLGAAWVLLTYLVLHFLNHALGLVSLAAMESGRHGFLALWRSVPGTVALYGAIAVHALLALWLLYQRRSLRMPAWEAAQYSLGLLLPALLARHPDAHVVVVDDNSPDGTGDIVAALARADARIHLIRRDRKLGLGSAYRAAFAWALERGYGHPCTYRVWKQPKSDTVSAPSPVQSAQGSACVKRTWKQTRSAGPSTPSALQSAAHPPPSPRHVMVMVPLPCSAS